MSKLLKSLIFRSSIIQKKIDEEHSSKSKDWLKILRLKKLRLKIKDKINELVRSSSRNLPVQYKALPLAIRIDKK